METISYDTLISELTERFNLQPVKQKNVRKKTVVNCENKANEKKKELEELLLKKDDLEKESKKPKISVGEKRVIQSNLIELEVEIIKCQKQLEKVKGKFQIVASYNLNAAKSKLKTFKEKEKAKQFLLDNKEQIFLGIKGIFLRLEYSKDIAIELLKNTIDKRKFNVEFMSLLRKHIEHQEFKYLINNCTELQHFLSSKMYEEYNK